jgi:hypothetical protein
VNIGVWKSGARGSAQLLTSSYALGVITAAQAATGRMYAEFSMASNIQSRICATGNPKWGAGVYL